MCVAAREGLKNIISTRVILEYLVDLQVGHLKMLQKVKHMHPKSVPTLREEPLLRIRAVAKAREDYLTFKLEDAGLIHPATRWANPSVGDVRGPIQVWGTRLQGPIQVWGTRLEGVGPTRLQGPIQVWGTCVPVRCYSEPLWGGGSPST